jgi:NO-binding membrane sensor protein with MHYT domain/signal transduction histidine kinase
MAAVNLIGSYNYALVALSVLIAIFASYAALDLAGRVTAARGWTRAVWLLGGAGAMGTGIWSMHYIGMLAFILPIPVAYHWPTVLLSLFAAILASVIALYVVSRQKMGASRAVAGSVLMGAGISSMHYIGMAAMRLPALCQFNSFLVVLSVVFAVLISLAALWITFQFRDEKTGIGREKLAGAVVMGAAIPVMHYTGMAAASFTPSGMSADLSHAVSISALGTAGIAAVTFIVLGLALLTSWVDRRFAVRILELQEKKLQRSEAYLAEAQRLSRTGSFGWRVAADEIIWSEETFRIFQYDRTTKPTVELLLQRVHPDDAALVKQTIERASQDGKNFEHEYRLLMPDSSVKYVRVVAHALSDESGSVEFVGAVMDVTERRRAVALRDGESRILEMTARDARLEDTLETLVHVVEAQFAGLLCSVLLLDEDGEHVRHGAAPNLPKAYSEAIDGLSIGPKAGSCGTAMYRREPVVVIDILQDPLWEDYRDVAGRYGLRACWSTPILSHSGKALGSFAMYYREPRNPSPAETSALEMATHLAGIAIERKLAREERERLRQAQADLAHINRVTTMGELTASLAHEIKQPITAAVTDAKTCVRWLRRDEPDVAEACEAASRVVTDVTRAADIISRISSLFKKGALRHEFVDLNELIQEMIALLRSEAARYSILIRSELAEGLPNIMAERVQLQQVFMNLMLNGIDAMKDVCTAGELTIKSQQLKDDQLLVSVSDTGVGLPQLESEKMFNAFFTTKAHGTGMGLPISRSIIESHGGRLWASSNSGRGASFHFTLPNKGQSHTASAQGDVSQSA